MSAEVNRLRLAVQQAKQEIQAMLEKSALHLTENDRKIFDAHRLFLSDPDLISQTEGRIKGEHINAEAAWSSVVAEAVVSYCKLQSLFDPLQPAVIKAIKLSIDGARSEKIEIGMCGSMAANELAAPLLLGLGLDEFSMNSCDIPMFKSCCANLHHGDCEAFGTRSTTA